MIGYAERQCLSPGVVQVYRRACALVDRVLHAASDDSEVRCHELARAVARQLAASEVSVEVVDGSLWWVEHTWILLSERGSRALLDVYTPGRVPQVQLLDDHPAVSRGYERGLERRDVRLGVVDELCRVMDPETASEARPATGELAPRQPASPRVAVELDLLGERSPSLTPPAGFYWARRSSGGAWTVIEVSRVGDDCLFQAVGEACDRSDYFGKVVVVEWGPRLEPPGRSLARADLTTTEHEDLR